MSRVQGPVNICFQNGGGIRASIKAGPVTVGDIITVLPFSNIVTVKKVSCYPSQWPGHWHAGRFSGDIYTC
jgi:2',3'-cyclic-nucleotide 2'-phosphodiesterase (5'-nucleotidase family)